jgi:hypothetical protein
LSNALPARVPVYLRRLRTEYKEEAPTLARMIEAARVAVTEDASYDNWNGGTNLHDVHLFLPADVLGTIKLRDQNDVTDRICQDLNMCARSFDNEGFRRVTLELEDEEDPVFHRAQAFGQGPSLNPDSLSIRQPGQIRVFVSHRDAYKKQAHALADALQSYGISSFVAHDTIEPMTTWQREILNGLQTMEVMLALVTDDFEASYWTQQEVGYALGRGIDVIPLKLGAKAPAGFIGSIQALKGDLSELPASAGDIYTVLADKLGKKDRLQTALITAFTESTNYPIAIERFDRMHKVVRQITEDEYITIAAAFLKNDQLHGCNYLLNNRLKKFLQEATGHRIMIDGGVITRPDVDRTLD